MELHNKGQRNVVRKANLGQQKNCISAVFGFNFLRLEPNACISAVISAELTYFAREACKTTAVLQAFLRFVQKQREIPALLHEYLLWRQFVLIND
jgi:hypothetical protein